MQKRNYIENGEKVTLYGESDGKRFSRTFEIKEHLNKGGASAICYSAQYDKSSLGILKEFYPLDSDGLKRDVNNSLINIGSSTEKNKFINRLNEYLKPYDIMLKTRNTPELASFIPHFELYYTDNEYGTVYIWTSAPELETFEKLCESIHNNPSEKPEHKLLNALSAIKELIKCVCALHSAELLHGDIKPSNFGFLKRGEEVLTETIQMFDINTICSVYDIPNLISFSKGFDAPELYQTGISNLTDIYAIGATLFNAVIVTDETAKNDYLYAPEFYSKIEQFVNESELINSCSDIIHPKFKSALCHVLKNSLCVHFNRYQCCEDMLDDLNKALNYISPTINDSNEKWVLEDADNLLDSSVMTKNLVYHLYKYPLYQNVPNNKEYIDLILIGFGRCGQKFLDISLQIAQMPGKKLNVTVISDSCDDKSLYLSQRPELEKFFNIDGSLENENDTYGNIRFITHAFSKTGGRRNMSFLADYKADYIFVSIGNYDFNVSLAKTIEFNCPVCAVVDGKRDFRKIPDNIIPLYITKDISHEPFFVEIERMAFNAHLIWKKNLNVDYSDIRKQYRKPYNHYSNISFVLAMKYKLHGIGIEMEGNLSDVAKNYLEYIKNNKKHKNELVMLEHRRWVTEKLCLGFTRITKLDECVSGMTKDEKKKRHICIVKSRIDSVLASKSWINGSAHKPNKEKWDNPSAADLESLDELERMSVELHLMYKKFADAESANNLLSGEFVSALHKYIEKDILAVISFQELLTCMKDISNNDSNQVKRYDGLKSTFLDVIKKSDNFTTVEKNSIKQLMISLHERFVPILESRKYRNYKLDDVDFIEGIPFILTYSSDLYMVIPFVTGSNNELFSNLAAAITINPYKITYLASCSSKAEIENIKNSLQYIAKFMEQKKLRASINFIIECTDGLNVSCPDEKENEFMELSSRKVQSVHFVESNDGTEYIEYIKEYIELHQKKKHRVIVEKNTSPISRMMGISGLYKIFPTYSFNAVKNSFINVHECSAVEYIRFKSFITVSDMFAFNCSTSTTSNKPEFYAEYKELWNIYKDYTDEWKYMCRCFKEYSDVKDIIAVFQRKGTAHTINEYTYIIPFICKDAILKILNALKSQKIIDDSSYVVARNTGSCLVVIKDLYGSQKAYDSIMNDLHKLMQPDFVKCSVNPKERIVKVLFNALSAVNVDCKRLNPRGYELIEYFYRLKFILNLSIDRSAKTVSFTYATPQIKDLLTSEGRMLEVYTYHKVKETGKFDDIRSSFEINWEDDVASNEFDCILTKGLNSLFIECKATNEIKSDYYTKLDALVRKFGINAIVVLIADTVDNAYTETTNLKMRKTGSGFDIITISERNDIDNIGDKLLSIMKSKLE